MIYLRSYHNVHQSNVDFYTIPPVKSHHIPDWWTFQIAPPSRALLNFILQHSSCFCFSSCMRLSRADRKEDWRLNLAATPLQNISPRMASTAYNISHSLISSSIISLGLRVYPMIRDKIRGTEYLDANVPPFFSESCIELPVPYESLLTSLIVHAIPG